MKKSELIEMIRVVVKEEVNQALPQLLMEVLAEKMAGSTEPVVEARRPQVAQPVRQATPAPRRAPIITKNPLLNQILSETTGGIPAETGTQLVSEGIQSGPTSVLDLASQASPEELANPEVSAVLGAFKKDYRSLLKAADAKAKQSHRP